MKKNLLLFSASVVLTCQMLAQETIQISNTVFPKLSKVAKASAKYTTNNKNYKVALTPGACGNDTIRYQELKDLALYTGTNTGYGAEIVSGNVRSGSMAYVVPFGAAVVVKGIELYTGLSNTATPTYTSLARAYVYSVNQNYKPLAKIDSADVVLTTAVDRYYAMFANPKTYTNDFAVAFASTNTSTVSPDFFYLVYNSAQTATSTVNNYGEGLSYRRYGAGSWNASKTWFGGTNDYEYIVSPIITHTYEVNFAQSSTALCLGQQITLTNTSTGTEMFESPFFNLSKFGQKWNIPTNILSQDSVYTWGLGNNTNEFNGSLVSYNAPSVNGTYNDTLLLVKQQYDYSYCAEWDIKSYNVSTCTSVNELNNAQLSVFPNPSNGVISIKNVSVNTMVELINILGEVVFKEKLTTDAKSYDFSRFHSGNYYIKLTTEDGKTSVKKLQFN
jgi:hypothetical protein